MEIQVTVDRILVQMGSHLAGRDGCTSEQLSGTEEAALLLACGTVVSGGSVRISPDHASIEVLPPSAEALAADASFAAAQQQRLADIALLAASSDPHHAAIARLLGG